MSQSTERWGWVSLGQMLLSDGILTQEQLAQALARQRKTRDRLGQILIEMKLLDEEVLLKYLGRQFRKEAITEQELETLDLDVVKLVPEEVARQYRIIAAERHGKKLVVATADPLNVVALDDLRRATGLEVDFKIGPGQAIQAAIDKTYRRMVSAEGIDDALRQDLGLRAGSGAGVDDAVDLQELRTQAADPPVVKLVPEEVARQYRIIAAERHGKKLVVATADPLNVVALDDLRRATGLEVDFKIGPGQAIQAAIDKSYRRMVSAEGIDDALRQDLGLRAGSGAGMDDAIDLQELRTQAADPPVVKVVNYVLSRAAADGASDVHVEAYEDRTRVRYRIDGLLFDLLEVPRSLHLAVVSRLKIISRLDIAERRLPQDGSFASSIAGREIDFRVSTLPTIYGEKVVLRLLEKEAVVEHYTLESLGFDPDQL
ncbi:MAG: hypothetical protein DMD83_11745, partial [Candidatus Rokuibacteriota bacterium]